MRTFEEACFRTIAAPIPDLEEKTVLQATLEHAAGVGRWQEIEEEIRTSALVMAYIASVQMLHEQGDLTLADCILTAFTQGVTVGVEMERNDEKMPDL